jgi:hypothetical protein
MTDFTVDKQTTVLTFNGRAKYVSKHAKRTNSGVMK